MALEAGWIDNCLPLKDIVRLKPFKSVIIQMKATFCDAVYYAVQGGSNF